MSIIHTSSYICTKKKVCRNNSRCASGHVKLSDCEIGQHGNALGNFFPADILALCDVALLLETHRGLCFRL